MKQLQHTIKAIIRPGEESGFVAECVEIAVVTQGKTLDETVRNLQEAVALHLEGENAADFGLRNPLIQEPSERSFAKPRDLYRKKN